MADAQGATIVRTPRKAAQKTGAGAARKEALPNYWLKNLPDLNFGEEVFRLTCFRPERNDPSERSVSVDHLVDSVTWEDAEPILKGTITMTKQEGKRPLGIAEGHIIRCEAAPHEGGKFRVIWDMRIMDSGITASSGGHSFSLADEMAWLSKSRDDWQFKKSKTSKQSDSHTHRPQGWTADQITKQVCRRYGVRVDKLAKGTKKINNITEKNTSPLAIIMRAYSLERAYSGRRFIIRFRHGKLQVLALRNSRTLLLMGGSLLDATINRTIKKGLATAAHVTATVKGKSKGKKASKHSKLEIDVVAHAGAARYGYIRKTIHLKDPVGTKAEARREAKRELAKTMLPNREVSFTHPGITSTWRGDAVKLQLPELGLQEIVYIKSVVHTVSAGEYTMDVTCQFTDPYIDKKGEEIQEKRCDKARKHNRVLPGFCTGPGKRPLAVANNQRAERPHTQPQRAR